MLEGGMPYDIPDFRKEEDRIKYENDDLSPYPPVEPEIPESGEYVVDIPCSSKPYTPPPMWLENHDKIQSGETPTPNDLEKQFIK